MVIMHYFLGFPPYRSGGLTRNFIYIKKNSNKEAKKYKGYY